MNLKFIQLFKNGITLGYKYMSQMLPYSFFNDVEKPLKYILYGDTDSDFEDDYYSDSD